MSLYLLSGALEEGLIYAFVALGLFISYNTLKIADMTTDGSFVLGSAVSAVFVMKGHPILGLALAMVAGAAAGFVTAFLQTRLGIPSILSGIITMTALYSVNLLVQGGAANLFFPSDKTIFSMIEGILGDAYGGMILVGILAVATALLLGFFFTTQIGLSIRATGDNINMVESSSINPKLTITVGLCLSNALVALSGGLLAQKNTQGDINIGTIVVMGLASLVIGGLIFRSQQGYVGALSVIVGSIIYRIIFTIAIRYTKDPSYLKIVSALVVAVVMAYPTVKKDITARINRKRREHHA